jgi:two-component system chemotaxis response regulator CheB
VGRACDRSMRTRRVIVLGASSGGIEALRTLVAALPADLPAAVCVVVHVAPNAPGILADILSRAGQLPATQAQSGMAVEHGHIYVARPDHHLLLQPGRLRLSKGPKENRSRPAIDPLFRSAAQIYGPAAIGVILTGNLDDGTAGLWTIKQLGGIAVVQDPADALYPSMPTHALHHVSVDYVKPLHEIGPLLAHLVARPIDERASLPATPRSLDIEMNIAHGQNAVDAGVETLGEPSPFACPECHGVLMRMKEGAPLRFRCHTGHAYSVGNLGAAINNGIEDAIWNAARALEEKSLLLEEMATAVSGRDDSEAARLRERAREIHGQSNMVRQVAMEHEAERAAP